MRLVTKLPLLLAIVLLPQPLLLGQDLAPRAYVVTPVHSNAVTLTWAFYNGGLNFTGTIPITTTGTYNGKVQVVIKRGTRVFLSFPTVGMKSSAYTMP
ncbi:MAG TPA: hypothetical protein VH437_16235 [Terriglobales bacterium]